MKTLCAAGLVIAGALGFAPTASATDQDYLDGLQVQLAAYTPQQLLTEAYRVCAFLAPGRPSADAVPLVVKDLNTSTSIAVIIVTAAVTEKPC